MKRILLSLVFFIVFQNSITFWETTGAWAIVPISNIPVISWGIWVNSTGTITQSQVIPENIPPTTWSTNNTSTIVSTTSNNNLPTAEWTVLPFCNLNSQSGIQDSYKSSKVTVRENKYIILTYFNTYWKDIVDQLVKSSDWKSISSKITKSGLLAVSNNPSSPARPLYDAVELACINFRLAHPDNNTVIQNLYKQVNFFSIYYSDYPDRLTEGITPGFIIFGISLVDTMSTFLMLVVVLNLIVWTVLYMVWPIDKKEDFWNRTILWFWYFLIVWLIKIGVLGSVIAFIGYQWLDFIKIFLPI